MKTLHLTLKKKWFDMIESGEKLEEYREIKPYWVQRLMGCGGPKERPDDHKHVPGNFCFDIMAGHPPANVVASYMMMFKEFDAIIFKNGYSKEARSMYVTCNGIDISRGREEWGAEPDKYYFRFRVSNPIKMQQP